MDIRYGRGKRPPAGWRVRALAMLAFALPALGSAAKFDHTHRLYGEVLVHFVQGGLVDYAGLKAGRGNLDIYLDQLAAVPEKRFKRRGSQRAHGNGNARIWKISY